MVNLRLTGDSGGYEISYCPQWAGHCIELAKYRNPDSIPLAAQAASGSLVGGVKKFRQKCRLSFDRRAESISALTCQCVGIFAEILATDALP